jgi:hypothetical protein
MLIAKIFLTISMIIFMLPPFRQYNGRFFYYFLILAIEDPIARVFELSFHFHPIIVHLLFGILLVLAVLKYEKFLKYALYSVPFLIVGGIGISFLNVEVLRILLALTHIIIFFIVAKLAVIFIRDTKGINFFHIMLILYESSIILKFITLVLNIHNGILLFYITLAFELFLGLFFSLFRDDSPKVLFFVHENLEKATEELSGN